MSTQTLARVIANLEKTIYVKEALLAQLQVEKQLQDKTKLSQPEAFGLVSSIMYLEINLEELRNILADLLK